MCVWVCTRKTGFFLFFSLSYRANACNMHACEYVMYAATQPLNESN